MRYFVKLNTYYIKSILELVIKSNGILKYVSVEIAKRGYWFWWWEGKWLWQHGRVQSLQKPSNWQNCKKEYKQ